LTLLSSIISYSENITRGPNEGEIYILGISSSGLDATIYHSTDFGETLDCLDSISQNTYWIECIEADKTSGGLYFVTAFGGLHYSNNFGQFGSWDFRQADISWNLCGGIVSGEVYNTFNSHSNDYGITFYSHSAIGFFGGLKYAEIDNLSDHGYIVVNKWGISDSIYFLRTNDNFENLVLDTVFNFGYSDNITLSHGIEEGELFMFNSNNSFSRLWYSNDFAIDWNEMDDFNFNHDFLYRKGFEAGQINGELYFVLHFVSNMWQNTHTYIFHSNNYGITFEVFHPLSKGNEPVLANFSTLDREVHLTEPVGFSNFSIGDIIEYQWDFENDGIIDSYDEFPTYIFQDTGYYSVKLSVINQDDTNTFIKENYIHVIDTLTINPDLNYHSLKIYPNPFNDHISIETRSDFKRIDIYDINGKSHLRKPFDKGNKTEIIDLRKLEKGIYILKIITEEKDITKKIIKI
jgi:PKD repeat protein